MFLVYVEGLEKNWLVEFILFVMGFIGLEDYFKNVFGIELDERSNVKVGNVDFMINVFKVFVIGDVRCG